MENEKMKKSREDFLPLYRKGDYFIIVGTDDNPNHLPIHAKHLKSRQVYGFEIGELEEA